MRRCSPVVLALALGLAACGPGIPGSDGWASDDHGFSDDHGDGDGESGSGDGDGDGDDEDEGDGDGDELSVLLIGNSYTYTNDLPGMIESMAAASSIPVRIESLTGGGYYVASHLDNPELASLLAQDFDVVVIQGNPFEPVLEYPLFEYGVVEVVSMAGDARVVLFQTWPRSADNQELIDLGMTVEEMWAGLEHGYLAASQTVDAEIATVGAAWMSALELEPPIELYSIDGNHPIYAGSYLAASVLFGVIFDETCTTNGWDPAGFSEDDRDRLRIVADVINGKLDP